MDCSRVSYVLLYNIKDFITCSSKQFNGYGKKYESTIHSLPWKCIFICVDFEHSRAGDSTNTLATLNYGSVVLKKYGMLKHNGMYTWTPNQGQIFFINLSYHVLEREIKSPPITTTW